MTTYGPGASAALLVLMVENREVPNTELSNDHKIRLGPDDRARLNTDGLLTSVKAGRTFLHRITDKGIDWCVRDILDGAAPSRSGPLARVHTQLLQRFVRYHQQRGTLAEAMGSGGGASLEGLIREAYLALADEPQDWIRLARLRPKLNGAAKSEVDGVLLRMKKTGTVHLVPDSNRKALTDADHAAAIRIGGEDKHLMAIEES